jgi:subtilisin family serine protease
MARKAKTTKTAKKSKSSGSVVPDRIFAQASPRSVGGLSMFEAQHQIHSDTVSNFFSDEEVVNRTVNRLQDAGFEILQVSPLTINIAGDAKTYERAFNTKIYAEERPVIKELGRKDTATFLDSPDTTLPGLISTADTKFADLIEGVAIEEPRYFMATSMFPPLKAYWHLDVPAGISLGDNADRAHRAGITGKGVSVAMCDTGWFKHPYFLGRGYNAAPVVLGPATANPLDDEVGHGTGESANIFAVAPDIDFMPVKISFVNTIGGFNAAVGLNPNIITCSWGSSNQFGPLSAADQALAASISAAVAAGITVIFSAGNGHWGFPGQHPDVISAGGTFMNSDESLQASNYASGFMSNIYPGRRVPDLCGLVGMLPRAIYIMLPLQPRDQIDNDLSGGAFPNGDETANSDGWAAFSGTSAAAPQLAGAAALVKQACPALKPADIRDILRKSARDVTTGHCHANTGGNPATVGPDLATGYGLVDAQKAVLLAKVRCLGPILPIQPITIKPIKPILPIQPVLPIKPIIPIQPVQPVLPIRPIQPGPIKPIEPPRPIAPVILPSPERPQAGREESGGERGGSQERPERLTTSDVQALEEMIIKSEIDLGK